MNAKTPPQGPSIPLLSVVICTRNRVDVLPLALDSLAKQAADPQKYEVLVVDNASTDATRAVVQQWRGLPGLRCVTEGQIGLSNARNRGWREARGEYVAYLDDDCAARPDWIVNMCAALRRDAPAVCGGPYFALFMRNRPPWYSPEFGSWTLGTERRELQTAEHVHGGNMVIRRDILRRTGGFRADLGMIGSILGFGEEVELQDRIRTHLPGERIIYCPGVVVDHLVRDEKMTLRWQLRHRIRGGLQAATIYPDEAFCTGVLPQVKAIAYMGYHFMRLTLSLVMSPFRSRRQCRYWRTYIMRKVCPRLYSVAAYLSFIVSPFRRRVPHASDSIGGT